MPWLTACSVISPSAILRISRILQPLLVSMTTVVGISQSKRLLISQATKQPRIKIIRHLMMCIMAAMDRAATNTKTTSSGRQLLSRGTMAITSSRAISMFATQCPTTSKVIIWEVACTTWTIMEMESHCWTIYHQLLLLGTIIPPVLPGIPSLGTKSIDRSAIFSCLQLSVEVMTPQSKISSTWGVVS